MLSSWWPNKSSARMKFTTSEFLVLQLSHPYSPALKQRVNYYLEFYLKEQFIICYFQCPTIYPLSSTNYHFRFGFFLPKIQITACPVHGVYPNFRGVTHSLFIRYCNRLIVLPVWSPKQTQQLSSCCIILPKCAESPFILCRGSCQTFPGYFKSLFSCNGILEKQMPVLA